MKKWVALRSRSRLARLLRYMWPQWRTLLLVLLATGAQVVTSLARPWPVKLLVDHVLDKQPLPTPLHHVFLALPGAHDREALLVWVCAGLLLIVVAGLLVSMVYVVSSAVFNQRVTYALAADLFLHIQRLSLLFHSRRPVGDTVSRVTVDPTCVQQLVNSILLMLQSVLTMILTFIILWNLSPAMTIAALGLTPFMFLSGRVFQRPMKARSRERRDLEGTMMAVVETTLSGIPAVQAFNREEREAERFRHYTDDTVVAYRRAAVVQAMFFSSIGLIMAASQLLLMYVGGRQALAGHVTTGVVVVFLFYLMGLYQPLQTLGQTFAQLQLAAAQADRVMELLELPPDVQDTPGALDTPVRGEVEYEDVVFGYNAQAPVLKGVSFRARPGEVIAIVGPTGAGKTTLVSLLVRFFDPWTGRVTVDGHDIRSLRLSSLRRQVSIVLQDPFLFPFSVAENIAYGRPDATREEVVAAAAAANADDFIRGLPHGYDTVIGERGVTLSGGERQRLAIARAFLKDAPILILDEPTSALDARTEASLLTALERLMKDRTTIIIAHRLSTIRKANRILVMDHGEIVERGRHSELMEQEGMYAVLYRQQMDIARHDVAPDASR